MKYLKYLFIFIFLSCSDKPSPSNLEVGKKYFGPNLKDNIVDLKTYKANKKHTSDAVIATYDLLATIDNAFKLSPEDPYANQVFKDFYLNSGYVTKVAIEDGTYVHTAIAMFGTDILNTLTKANLEQEKVLNSFFAGWSVLNLEEYVKKQEGFFGLVRFVKEKLSLDVSKILKRDPAIILRAIIWHLEDLPKQLEDYGLSPIVIDKINQEIQTKTQGLQEAAKALDIQWNAESLEEILYKVKYSLDKFYSLDLIDKKTLASFEEQFAIPKMLVKAGKNKTVKNFITFLFDVFEYEKNKYAKEHSLSDKSWSNQEVVDDFIESTPKPLREFFSWAVGVQDQEDYQWYKRQEGSFMSPIRSYVLSKIRAPIVEGGVENYYKQFETSVAYIIKDSIARELSAKYINLSTILAKTVSESFIQFEENLYDNFYSVLYKIAKERIQQDLLNHKSYFPGLEKKLLKWPVKKSSNNQNSPFTTGAKEIGQGITTMISWLKNTEDYNKKQLDSYSILGFSLLNKMLAAYGFRYYSGDLYPNLHQAFDDKVDTLNLDIYTYQSEDGVFAIPDNIRMKQGYEVLRQEQVPVQTLGGMASLLNASAKQLVFFADYNKNSFDKYFTDFDFAGFHVFPKEPLFDLSLGSALVLLTNLSKNGILFYDKDGNVFNPGDIESIKEQSRGARGVTLLYRRGNESVKEVDAEDLANMTIALNNFINAAEKFNLVKFGLLSLETNGKLEALERVQKLLPSLKKLVYGLGLFMSNYLLDKDYRVHSRVNAINKNVLSDKYNTINQIKWLSISLQIHQDWQSNVFKWLAVDLYYALNQNYLDLKTGLYKFDHRFSYYQISQTLLVLQNFQSFVKSQDLEKEEWWDPESSQQLDKIINNYKLAWQEWGNEK